MTISNFFLVFNLSLFLYDIGRGQLNMQLNKSNDDDGGEEEEEKEKRKTKRREREELQTVESSLAVEEAFCSQIKMESKCVLVDTKWPPLGAVKMLGHGFAFGR